MNARHLVADLATRGLLTRVRATQDRRREQLSVTEAGERLVSRVVDESVALTGDLAARLGPDRYATLARLLATLDTVLAPGPPGAGGARAGT